MTDGSVRKKLRIGLIGAGLVGRKHARYVMESGDCSLAALADPSPAVEALAEETGAVGFTDAETMIDQMALDGVIIATPTPLHEPMGLLAVDRGLPMIVEKPIADELGSAGRLAAAAAGADVPLLVGHHRRYNPRAQKARAMIATGDLGRLIGINVVWGMCKPDDYFRETWRRRAGGGPILINLIHEIDMLRFLAGEVVEVMAMGANGIRGFEVEDSVALTLRFASGALASLLLSDAAPSPWSWEQASGENHPTFPENDQIPIRLLGSEAAMEFPSLTVWRHDGPKDWRSPMVSEAHSLPKEDVFATQIAHFARVIRGEDTPLITGADARLSLAATLAVVEAAATGQRVLLGAEPPSQGR